MHVLEIEIPPLRRRREDIKELVEFFLDCFSLQPMDFSAEAMATLVKYSFPGNVRELEHIVQRTITLARGSIIGPDDLPVEVHQHSSSKGTLAERLSLVEKQTILQALEKYNWIQTRAAEELGISERVLRYKMAKLQLK